MQSDEWWWHLPPDTHNSSPGAHLFVCQHGLWGSPEDVSFLEQYLRHSGWLTLNARSNSARCTFDGADVCGDRLAAEVVGHVKRLAATGVRVTHISFAAYSFGGLIARYAVGKLLASGFFRCVLPVNFLTIATPHLGCWEHPSSMSQLAYNSILPWTLSRTGRQLLLADRWLEPEGLPLLAVMARPDCAFHAALAAFRKRVLLADIRCDRTVPYTTAAITAVNPYFTAPPRAARGRQQGQVWGPGGAEDEDAGATESTELIALLNGSVERRTMLLGAAGNTTQPAPKPDVSGGREGAHLQQQEEEAEGAGLLHARQRQRPIGCDGSIQEEGLVSEAGEVREGASGVSGSAQQADLSSGLGGSDSGVGWVPPAAGGLRSLLHWASWGLGGGEGRRLGSMLFGIGRSGAGCAEAEEDDEVSRDPCCCCCSHTGECCTGRSSSGPLGGGRGEGEEGVVELIPAVIALPISSAYPCIVTPHPAPHVKHQHHPPAVPKPMQGLKLLRASTAAASVSTPTSPRGLHSDSASCFPPPKPDRSRSTGSGSLPRPYPSSAADSVLDTVSAAGGAGPGSVFRPGVAESVAAAGMTSLGAAAASVDPTIAAASASRLRTGKCGASSDGGGVGIGASRGASWLRGGLLGGILSRVGPDGGGLSDSGGFCGGSTSKMYLQPHCPHCPLHVPPGSSRWLRRGRGSGRASTPSTSSSAPADTVRCHGFQPSSHPTTTAQTTVSRLSRHANPSSSAMLPCTMFPSAAGPLSPVASSSSSGYGINYTSRRAKSSGVGEVRIGLRDAAVGGGGGGIDIMSRDAESGGDEDVFSSRVRLGLFLLLLPVLLSLWLCMVAWLAGIWIHHYAILLTVRPDRSWNVRLGWPMMSSSTSPPSAECVSAPAAAVGLEGDGAGSRPLDVRSEAGGERLASSGEDREEELERQEQQKQKQVEKVLGGKQDVGSEAAEQGDDDDADLDVLWSEGPLLMRFTSPCPQQLGVPLETVRPRHTCTTCSTAPSRPLEGQATQHLATGEVEVPVHALGPSVLVLTAAAPQSVPAPYKEMVSRTGSSLLEEDKDDEDAKGAALAQGGKEAAVVAEVKGGEAAAGLKLGKAAAAGQDDYEPYSTSAAVVVHSLVRSLFSTLKERCQAQEGNRPPRIGATGTAAGIRQHRHQHLEEQHNAVDAKAVRGMVRRIFQAMDNARSSASLLPVGTDETEVEAVGMVAAQGAPGGAVAVGNVDFEHMATSPLPSPTEESASNEDVGGLLQRVVRRVFCRLTWTGDAGLAGQTTCVPVSHDHPSRREALSGKGGGAVSGAQIGATTLGGGTGPEEEVEVMVRQVVWRVVLSVLQRNGAVGGTNTMGVRSNAEEDVKESIGSSHSAGGGCECKPIEQDKVMMVAASGDAATDEEPVVVLLRQAAQANSMTRVDEHHDPSYVQALVRRIIHSIMVREASDGEKLGASGVVSGQDICSGAAGGAVSGRAVDMGTALGIQQQEEEEEGVEERLRCGEALLSQNRLGSPTPCPRMQSSSSVATISEPAPPPSAREESFGTLRTSQSMPGPNAAQQQQQAQVSPSPPLQVPQCAQVPYDPAALLADMIAQLNQLEWQKVDVDTRHYHAHAAIVVRSSRRFRSHAHIIEYAVRQLKM